MIRKRTYRLVAEKLKKKGLCASMMRPHQLVFSPPSHMGGGWLTFYKGKWHIATWAPKLYRIQKEQNIAPLCKDFIASKKSGFVAAEIVTKYSLQEISDVEMEAMIKELEKASRTKL